MSLVALLPWLLLRGALAADVARYPLQAQVDLSACASCPEASRAGAGALRLTAPTGLRGPREGADGSSLLVVDAAGEVVPFAALGGDVEQAELWLDATPLPEGDSFAVAQTALPIVGLRVELPGDSTVATVEVLRQEGGQLKPHGAATLVWKHPMGVQDQVRFPAISEPLVVRLRWHQRGGTGAPRLVGVRASGLGAEPIRMRLPVVDARVEESGWARYTIALPGPLPVRRVALLARDGVFDRQVIVRGAVDPSIYQGQSGDQQVRRVRLGGANLDQATLRIDEPLGGDELVIYVQCEGLAPLDIPEVEIEVGGLDLLLLDPGPGPFLLYGGAPADTSPPSDLAVALPELARLAQGPVTAAEVVSNPDYVPPEQRADLVGPGVPISLRRFTRVHRLEGPAGLVAAPLTAEVLRGARSDLADLRVVDDQDNQVPYLLRRRSADNAWPDVDVQREERGAQSRLRVTLPEPGVPVGRLTLRSDAPVFDRTVTVSRAHATELEPLRVFRWLGADRPTALALDVDALVGDQLYVDIDNRDNAPLPITGVDLSWPEWELVLFLPEGGARLVYGDPRLSAPSYDLGLIGDEVDRRAVAVGALGPGADLSPPSLSRFDQAVLLVGLLSLVVGLAGLTLGLLRRVPDASAVDGGQASA